MSPEPAQEQFDQDLKANTNVSLNMRVVDHESDSEDESNIEAAGYMPLSQVPTDSDTLLDDDEDDEWMSATVDGNQMLSVDTSENQACLPSETVQVWASQCNKSSIDLDSKKIDQVKSMMASFTLPTTAIPEWAISVAEDEWKHQLINRITEIQQRKS